MVWCWYLKRRIPSLPRSFFLSVLCAALRLASYGIQELIDVSSGAVIIVVVNIVAGGGEDRMVGCGLLNAGRGCDVLCTEYITPDEGGTFRGRKRSGGRKVLVTVADEQVR